jgi:hypothetical protein
MALQRALLKPLRMKSVVCTLHKAVAGADSPATLLFQPVIQVSNIAYAAFEARC